MAFFGNPTSFLGIDIGTSSLKIVELIQRRKRIEVSTYAQAAIPNLLVDPAIAEDKAIADTYAILSKILNRSGVSADTTIAALPNSAVFSTVTLLPVIPDKEMDKAVRFAARDLVPADLDDMVLGWSRVASEPHMATDKPETGGLTGIGAQISGQSASQKPSPVFITAAPNLIVNRYTGLMQKLKLNLVALEVETFPLVRSLLGSPNASGCIVDIGDLNTTFHVIDAGTPRMSHTMELGGKHITDAIAEALGVSVDIAEQKKAEAGLTAGVSDQQKLVTEQAVTKQIDKAALMLGQFEQKSGHKINQITLIGGGASLKGLREYWSKTAGLPVQIGNPWKGLSYPQELDSRLQELGPTYGVAVGLALRGFSSTN